MPLALFRMAVALILLKDALYHLPLAHPFYDDAGWLPRYALLDGIAREHRFSLMDALAHEWMVVAFLLVWIGVLVALLLGYRTRWMTIANFIIVLSLHERNTFVLTGADNALRVLCFWMMFAPVGARYSLDALRRGAQYTVRPLSIWLLRLQFIMIYCSTVYLKLNGEVWRRGEALQYVLQLETILLPPGALLAQSPTWLLTALSHGTLLAEIIIPVALLLPIWQPRLRLIGITCGVALHGGIALTLAIPDFSLVMLAGYLLFVPGEWVDNAVARWRRLQSSNGESQNVTPDDPPQAVSWGYRLQMATLCVLLGLVAWWNIIESTAYTDHDFPPMPAPAQHIVRYTGLWQYWDLFAPLPLQIDGQLTIPGTFQNGFTMDLYTATNVTWQAPPQKFGPAVRWQKLEENIFFYEPAGLMESVGDYYCRYYNQYAVGGTYLRELRIEYRYRPLSLDETPAALQTDTLWWHTCTIPETSADSPQRNG